MLVSMTPPNKWRALLVVLVLGFWAGGAAAQSDDDAGWFEGRDATHPEPSDRPVLKIQGKGQYDPPPPDFRAEPPRPSDDQSPAAVMEDSEASDDEYEDGDSQRRAVGEFAPHLSPYGYWVDDSVYGRVWVPNRTVVGSNFRPYVSGGHWELTADDDWLWVSDYPFGWVTFHYGRWAWLSAGLGWGWVPGYVYSPAWVDFRIGSSGYVGWGPVPPYSVWRGGVFVSLGARRPIPYIFCATSYVFSPGLPRYVVYDRYRARSIAAQTYRYRSRYVGGSQVRVRGPSPREARIPNRYVPTRRVIAQPRGAYVASEYRGRREAIVRRDDDGRRRAVRAPSSPSESRYRSGPSPSREREMRSGSRHDRDRDRAVSPAQRGQRSAAPPPNGVVRQGQSTPRRATSGETRRRGDWDARPSEAPRARDDGGRDRGRARAQEPDRRAPAARGGDRRGPSRAASPSRGNSGNQHRSRSRDDR
jgi:hypothetical protein